jgi:mannose-6-phosphate isomerase-like protein (cupin superfamily)
MAIATSAEQLWFLDTLHTIHVSHEDGQGGICVMESLARRGDSPPLHVHGTEDEIFRVLDGELLIRAGDADIRLGAGETLLAPLGVPHTYRVESPTARWLVMTTQGDFERFVRELSRPAERPELPEPEGPPTPERIEALGAVAQRHNIELVGPPL